MSKRYPVFLREYESLVYDPEELINLFLDNTADGICIVDMENRFIRVNRMFTEIFGYTEEDVIGRRFDEFPNPNEVKEIIHSVKQGKSFHNIIAPRYHKNGNMIDVAVSYSPFRNTAGEIIATLAIYRDITDRVNMERELKQERELLKLITDNTTDLIKILSKDFKVVYVSPAYEKIFGAPLERLIGQSVLDLVPAEEQEEYLKLFPYGIGTTEPKLLQQKIQTFNGETIYAEFNISPIYNDKNEIESYVSVGRNITDRVNNDQTIRNLDRLSIIGQLAAGVAHEIRNPLTSLKGFSKLLKGSPEKDKQDRYLSIIMNELDRIDMIVNEFMSLAKPQAIQFEQVNLHSILESTVNILHPQALLHNVQIINHYHKDDIELLCSPHQLKQVFVNFLKNAIEAMPSGGKVHIRVQKLKEKQVRICFADEGAGIDSELLPYLGTPFYTTKDKGIGLGLTVSNKIIQEHRGTMRIESKPGQGTSVEVELTYI
jgi:two-component system, sporulation sensor kinase A